MSTKADIANKLDRDEISQFCNLVGMAPRVLAASRGAVTEKYDLGPRGAWILGLTQRGINSPSKLTEVLCIQRSLVTLELSRLSDAGLVTTSRNPEDGRRLVVKLTAKGRRVCQELEDAVEEFVLGRFAGLEREELLALLRALRSFVGSPGFVDPR